MSDLNTFHIVVDGEPILLRALAPHTHEVVREHVVSAISSDTMDAEAPAYHLVVRARSGGQAIHFDMPHAARSPSVPDPKQ